MFAQTLYLCEDESLTEKSTGVKNYSLISDMSLTSFANERKKKHTETHLRNDNNNDNKGKQTSFLQSIIFTFKEHSEVNN